MRKADYQALKAYSDRKASGDAVEPLVLHKMHAAAVKQVGDPAARTLSLTLSNSKPDRSSDTIAQDGWQLDNYKRNSVVLWAHDYKILPVGKSNEIGVKDDELHSLDEFAPPELSEFADTVYRMLQQGYLSACSVGFDPIQYVYNTERGGGGWWDPIDFIRQELLEHSIVPVPAHPDALVDAKAKGINVAPIRAWAIRALDEWSDEKGLYLPQSAVLGALKAIDTRSLHGPVRRGQNAPDDSFLALFDAALAAAKETPQEPDATDPNPDPDEEPAKPAGSLEDQVAQLAADVAALKAQRSGRVLSGVNAESVQNAHGHAAAAVGHLKSVMDAAGLSELDAGDLDNVTNPLDATDPDNDADGDAAGVSNTATVINLGDWMRTEFGNEVTRQYAAKTGRLI